MKREFYYPSCGQRVQIHAIEWIPEGEVKAILQISHGMAEYINRYDEFANYLCKSGFYVVGQDHLGHGQSITHEDDLGFFHETHGNEYVVGDIRELRRLTAGKYPSVPYFMLGHSMGSFLLRQYLQTDGKGLAGAIIMGTGYQPAPLLRLGKLMCRLIAGSKGWQYRSSLINNMGLGGYNKSFQSPRTSVDWITKDETIVDNYMKDPLCTFVFTVNGYYHLFCGMQTLTKKANVDKVLKDLPVLFASGEEDPVGGFGKAVRKVYQQYTKAGIKDVQMKLYKNDRHEILNETDRWEIYEDIHQWLEQRRIYKKNKAYSKERQ